MGRHTTVVSKSTWLPYPREQVFAAVMSPEIAPQIDPGVRKWEPDQRPIGVGTQFTIRGRFQWLPVRGVSRVTVWDRPNRAEFESVKPSWPLRLTAAHTFDLEPDGTQYTWTVTFHHENWLGRLATRLAARLLGPTIAEQHKSLATWLRANADAAELAQL